MCVDMENLLTSNTTGSGQCFDNQCEVATSYDVLEVYTDSIMAEYNS